MAGVLVGNSGLVVPVTVVVVVVWRSASCSVLVSADFHGGVPWVGVPVVGPCGKPCWLQAAGWKVRQACCGSSGDWGLGHNWRGGRGGPGGCGKAAAAAPACDSATCAGLVCGWRGVSGPSGDRSLGQVSENSTHVRAICCSGDMLAGCCVAAVLSRVFPGSRRALSGVMYIFAGMSWLLL